MEIEYRVNDNITPEEMQSLVESIGFGQLRSLERNKVAIDSSLFIASARYDGKLIGLIRLVGDSAYIVHMADMEVHPDFQNKGVGRKLMKMALDFAKSIKVGCGDDYGEFTLFANVGADRFYEKFGFILAPNGMVLTDTKSRRKYELQFQKRWTEKRAQKR
jgi:GNAT superfamily N-acetyltransferase